MDNNRSEGMRWFEQAKYDLLSAKWNSDGHFYDDACFKSQQACEKALKAFCYSKGERNILGHSTRDLLLRCSKYEDNFNKYMTNCKRLDKFYITARYPDGLPSGIPHEYFEKEEADEAISFAKEVLDFVEIYMSE